MSKKLILNFLIFILLLILPFIFAEAYLNLTHKLETRKFSELKNFNANPRIYNSDYGWELKKL